MYYNNMNEIKILCDLIQAVGLGNVLTVIFMFFFMKPLATRHFMLIDELVRALKLLTDEMASNSSSHQHQTKILLQIAKKLRIDHDD